jgi:hypothetical protein
MPSDSARRVWPPLAPPFYRVEAHDGKGWTFGIRMNDNTGMPRLCSLENADIGQREDIEALALRALALCGGTLRVVTVPLD